MELEKQIEITQDILEEHQYEFKRVKSPKKKRVAKSAIEFWWAINNSLKELYANKNGCSYIKKENEANN